MAAPHQEFVINGRFLTQPITGVQRVARELTRAIDRLIGERNYAASFRLACEPHADLTTLPLSNIAVDRFGPQTGHRWEQIALPRALRGAELLCLGNTAPLWSLASRSKVTVMLHDLSYRSHPQAYSHAYRMAHAAILPLILRRAHRILTVSETEKASLCELDPGIAPRIVVAQNGGWSNLVTVRNPADEPPRYGRDYLLYVGSLSRRKNFAGLLEVAVRLARERGLPFLFVGSASSILTQTSFQIPDDVQHLIRFAGQVEDFDLVAEIYRNARCLVFPSFYEASPLPPLEAMQFGCPVVGSDIPSMRERCGDAISYCDPTSTEDIVRAVTEMVENAKLVEQIVQRGYERAARYSWLAQAEHILAALTSGEPSPGHR